MTTNQPDTKSNPKPNPITKQHTIVSIQLDVVTCAKYPEKFIWNNVVATFLRQPDISLTNQLTVSQVADWSTRRLVNLPNCLIQNLEHIFAVSVISSRLHILSLQQFNRVRVSNRARLKVKTQCSNSGIYLSNFLSTTDRELVCRRIGSWCKSNRTIRRQINSRSVKSVSQTR